MTIRIQGLCTGVNAFRTLGGGETSHGLARYEFDQESWFAQRWV